MQLPQTVASNDFDQIASQVSQQFKEHCSGTKGYAVFQREGSLAIAQLLSSKKLTKSSFPVQIIGVKGTRYGNTVLRYGQINPETTTLSGVGSMLIIEGDCKG